jgi:hypothetical protein
MASYADAISSIESGGRYGIVGPTHPKLGRALGKYQVMEANVGPWTEKYLGRRLTADEFLSSPEAQDAVFKGQFGEYAAKHGPEGAARAWFAGEGGMNDMGRRDSLGTSVADYARKFNAAFGGGGGEPAASGGGILPGPQQGSPDPSLGLLASLMGGQPSAGGQGSNPMAGLLSLLGGQAQSGGAPQQQAPAPPPPPLPPMMRPQMDLSQLLAVAQQQPRLGNFSWS